MCGRYLRRSDKQRLAETFRLARTEALEALVLPDWDFNVAPTTLQPVIRLDEERGERELVLMRWGLVPWFAKSPNDFGYSTINAKAETVATSRLYQGPLERRRCLVPADGFYEWKVLGEVEAAQVAGLFGDQPVAKTSRKKAVLEKQPYAFTLRSGGSLAFAGLWERWRDPGKRESTLETFTVITTEPNELTAEVHTRMPVILEPKDYALWLDVDEGRRLPVELLRPFPAEQMQAAKAHRDVGNVKNNSPELMVADAPVVLNSR
jgi:putative SOS response-associated peptidase YedK